METGELTFVFLIGVAALSFICEYMDATLGMGYGTTLTPLLLLVGLSPGRVVPAILVSQLIANILASLFHHLEGNVNFRPSSSIFHVKYLFSLHRGFQQIRQSFPMHLKIGLLFGLCGIVSAPVAVWVAVRLPKFWLNLYIGTLVFFMGVLILVMFNRKLTFSFWKITGLGLFASFNKGLSGGGYGPIICAGQILSGVEGKNAVGITALAEGITCFAAVLMYLCVGDQTTNWQLAPWITGGAVLSVPLSAKSVKIIGERKLKLAIAVLTIILGAYTIFKTLQS
ncbi:MAG: sulfite exporter TauE/SafE family protein [Planctomycetales bacterium]|nr:sulfite exporter TauE/SafE family protein [Planctomycetales bacterium]